MNGGRQILLRLRSNIQPYEITVWDGGGVLRKRISSLRETLCICSCRSCIRIVARPLTAGYSTSSYCFVDTCCGVVELSFSFPSDSPQPSPQPALQTFTLTDATYGLPIDGSLLFTGS